MTYQQAAEFLEEHDLRVLVLPDRSGFAVFRTRRRGVLRALALGDTFEAAVENAMAAAANGADFTPFDRTFVRRR
jgi:hypothetical protein